MSDKVSKLFVIEEVFGEKLYIRMSLYHKFND